MTDTYYSQRSTHTRTHAHTHTHAHVSGQCQTTLQSAGSPLFTSHIRLTSKNAAASEQSFLVKRTSLSHRAVMKRCNDAQNGRSEAGRAAHAPKNMDSGQATEALTFEPFTTSCMSCESPWEFNSSSVYSGSERRAVEAGGLIVSGEL